MLATIAGKLDVAKFLVVKGADINARDNDGKMPLMWAMGNRDMEAFLKQHGAKE